ncbi:MAG: DUF1311 domain-containing protein [Neisseria sp.]|jgi:hypothetical protein|uniref:lysozyme inhibitor LprI family protein n=1 Tax=Neisseria sicca TaxID=490 RepID=UPI000D305BB2|nr:lysozyme inhibitor LprI family protein [Neisseria sicca]RKV72257.1 MAG: DUF1311 domain-containing protein [Neisseria sp.]
MKYKTLLFLLLTIPAMTWAEKTISHIEQADSYERSYNKSKLEMNNIYREMQKSMPMSEISRFNSVQAKWVAYRNANCQYYGRHIASQMECLENMNIARIKEMHKILDSYK